MVEVVDTEDSFLMESTTTAEELPPSLVRLDTLWSWDLPTETESLTREMEMSGTEGLIEEPEQSIMPSTP